MRGNITNFVIMEKARPHKYIKRLGMSGQYQYVYRKSPERQAQLATVHSAIQEGRGYLETAFGKYKVVSYNDDTGWVAAHPADLEPSKQVQSSYDIASSRRSFMVTLDDIKIEPKGLEVDHADHIVGVKEPKGNYEPYGGVTPPGHFNVLQRLGFLNIGAGGFASEWLEPTTGTKVKVNKNGSFVIKRRNGSYDAGVNAPQLAKFLEVETPGPHPGLMAREPAGEYGVKEHTETEYQKYLSSLKEDEKGLPLEQWKLHLALEGVQEEAGEYEDVYDKPRPVSTGEDTDEPEIPGLTHSELTTEIERKRKANYESYRKELDKLVIPAGSKEEEARGSLFKVRYKISGKNRSITLRAADAKHAEQLVINHTSGSTDFGSFFKIVSVKEVGDLRSEKNPRNVGRTWSKV